MTIIKPGEFWVANILFTNAADVKKRPVLVLWVDGEDAIVAVVTSARSRTQTDVELQHWTESGLRRASTVRLSRLDSLEKSVLIAQIGTVASDDAARIRQIWADFIKPQF